MSYRVDALPLPLRPLVSIFGWLTGGALVLLWACLRSVVRVRHLGRPSGSTIQCGWHQTLLPYFIACLPYREPEVWLNHPFWWMKGVHVFLRWMGVGTLALGSSGHGGRRALEQLVPLVASGASTFLNPDGPAGPAHVVKDGVLDLGQQTGRPVVALHLRCSRALALPTWDRKLLPWPGSTIEVSYSPPWRVSASNREEVREALKAFMDHGRLDDRFLPAAGSLHPSGSPPALGLV